MTVLTRAASNSNESGTQGLARRVPLQSSAAIPPGYRDLLEDIKNRVRRAQVRAAVAGNRELLCLYWEIGHEIVTRQRRDGWGARVIDCLAADLQKVFPGIRGFSRTNIHRMRAFYSAYAGENEIVPQAVGQLESAGVPSAVAHIPWGHNVVLLEKLKDNAKRLWYAHKTVQHGWSRAVLVHHIESNLFGREGQAVTNFSETLPVCQSDLAQQTVKDPYASPSECQNIGLLRLCLRHSNPTCPRLSSWRKN